MIAIRKATKSALRRLYRSCRVRMIEDYGLILAETLRQLSPGGRSDPTIALLTPGVYNSAFYEHMFLARQLGAYLVEGRDLLGRRRDRLHANHLGPAKGRRHISPDR